MAVHDEFDDFFADDDSVPVVDTRADGRLYRVPLTRIAVNRVNPRENFGTEDELIDLGKSLGRRQNQACPVVSRSAYLKLWPEHAEETGDVDYVLVSGERRHRAANTVGLPALDCVVNDDFARDRKTFMEAVVSENVDRQNFDAIEEAYAVQALVGEFGSNRAVAQHFERADGWVTQRILLTHLAPEMQQLVREKSMPLEVARSLGKKARDNGWCQPDQAAWWQEEQQSRKEKAASAKSAKTRGTPRQSTSPEGSSPSPGRPSESASGFTAVKPEAPDGALALSTVKTPGQRSAEPTGSPVSMGGGLNGVKSEESPELTTPYTLLRLLNSPGRDLNEWAEILGQNLSHEELEFLVTKLNSWL